MSDNLSDDINRPPTPIRQKMEAEHGIKMKSAVKKSGTHAQMTSPRSPNLSANPSSRYDEATFSPTKHHMQKLTKKETGGKDLGRHSEEKSTAAKQILYNQPNLFLEDANLFTQGIDQQL